ncbi:MAG: hypothetical protein HQM16_10165 [Deltaproteobacteria bacterium]|nr:hypothetical protein [Deltaproteobacteria bacterium]
MISLSIGFIVMILGLWGLAANWYAFVDLAFALVPFVLVVLGVIAVVSGIKGMREKNWS